MADENVSSNDNHFINEVANARAEAKKYRQAKRRLSEEVTSLKAAHDAALKELESFKKAPNALKDELDALKAEKRERVHKDVFYETAKAAKVRPEALEDLWKLSGYKAELDVPDPAQIQGLIGEAVKSRPYLVAQETPAPKTLQAGPGYARGGGEVSDVFALRPHQYQDPAFMRTHQAEILKAQREGKFKLLSD